MTNLVYNCVYDIPDDSFNRKKLIISKAKNVFKNIFLHNKFKKKNYIVK